MDRRCGQRKETEDEEREETEEEEEGQGGRLAQEILTTSHGG